MSSEKIVIVGANHAGLAVARNLIDSGKEFEITMIDKSDDLGYLSCGTPLLLGNEVNSYRNFSTLKMMSYVSRSQRYTLKRKSNRSILEIKK